MKFYQIYFLGIWLVSYEVLVEQSHFVLRVRLLSSESGHLAKTTFLVIA